MSIEQPKSGGAGDSCPQCGSGLAPDQRYCLNCGWRRGEARVDYETQILGRGQPATAGAPVAGTGPTQQWSPIMALGTIALLGVFLLLGVLIGKDDSGGTTTVAGAAPATTTTTASTPANTTPTTASKASKPDKKAADTAPGQGNVVQGGSGSTEGIQAADTNASPQEQAKNGPDVVATGGAPEKLDPNGQAGGGSSATCIGC